MTSPALYDITPVVSPRLGVWPGDTPLSRQVLLDLARGDTVTLSSLTGTVHLGAHTDAPSHYGLEGRDIAAQPLERYLGPCQVVSGRRSAGVPGSPRRCSRHRSRSPGC
ncbi:MAG: cyclase family protein [Gemmatimonadales bacterium]